MKSRSGSFLDMFPTYLIFSTIQIRLAFFYLISLTISGFSPILAYVFSLLDGKRVNSFIYLPRLDPEMFNF